MAEAPTTGGGGVAAPAEPAETSTPMAVRAAVAGQRERHESTGSRFTVEPVASAHPTTSLESVVTPALPYDNQGETVLLDDNGGRSQTPDISVTRFSSTCVTDDSSQPTTDTTNDSPERINGDGGVREPPNVRPESQRFTLQNVDDDANAARLNVARMPTDAHIDVKEAPADDQQILSSEGTPIKPKWIDDVFTPTKALETPDRANLSLTGQRAILSRQLRDLRSAASPLDDFSHKMSSRARRRTNRQNTKISGLQLSNTWTRGSMKGPSTRGHTNRERPKSLDLPTPVKSNNLSRQGSKNSFNSGGSKWRNVLSRHRSRSSASESEDGELSDPRFATEPRFQGLRWLLLLLFFLGVIASAFDYLLEFIVHEVLAYRQDILSTNMTYGEMFTVWVVYLVLGTLIAMFVTFYLSPYTLWDNDPAKRKRRSAATGGIPELKTILAGSDLAQWLSIRMYCAKWTGMLLALSAGLLIGKEGPFVHMSCIVGFQLCRLLQHIRNQKDSKVPRDLQDIILQASAAVALGSAFRAPIGGVLFSVEVTAANYKVSNYSKGFLSAVFGATIVFLIGDGYEGYRWSLAKDSHVVRGFKKQEIPVFLLMGCAFGTCAPLFVWLYTRLRFFQKWAAAVLGLTGSTRKSLQSGALFCVVYATITAVLQFTQGEYATKGLRSSVSDLWTEADLSNPSEAPAGVKIRADNWGRYGNPGWACLAYAGTVFVCCTLTITLPLVAGLFTPTIAVGAALGRAVGELMAVVFPELHVSKSGYAYVGAAAFSSGCTQTISTTIAVLEMTGELDYAVPMLLAVVLSVQISSSLSSSIFERICKLNNLPHIFIPRCDIEEKVAVDAAVPGGLTMLPVQPTYGQIVWALTRNDQHKLAELDPKKFWVPTCGPELVSQKRDDLICIVEWPHIMKKTPKGSREHNGYLVGVSKTSVLLDLVETKLDELLVPFADIDSEGSLSTPYPSTKGGGSMTRRALKYQNRVEAVLREKRDNPRIANLILRMERLFKVCPKNESANFLESKLDLMQAGAANSNIILEAPRVSATLPLRRVIDFMLGEPSQFVFLYDYDGELQGQITIEQLNAQLLEWRKQEKAEEKMANKTKAQNPTEIYQKQPETSVENLQLSTDLSKTSVVSRTQISFDPAAVIESSTTGGDIARALWAEEGRVSSTDANNVANAALDFRVTNV